MVAGKAHKHTKHYSLWCNVPVSNVSAFIEDALSSTGFKRGGNLFVTSCASSQSIGLYPFSLQGQHRNTGPARKGRCQENPIPSGSIDL